MRRVGRETAQDLPRSEEPREAALPDVARDADGGADLSRDSRRAMPLGREAPPATPVAKQEFLDRLMPLYPKALAYAQTITGSLMDGEDLVQDAVLNAYSRFATLRNRDRFREWFFAILLNRFRNLRNRQRLRPLTLVAGPDGSQSFWEATVRVSGDPAELGYQLTLVKELLARLNPPERETVLLLGSAEFSVDEVARIQHCTRRAVIQRAYRARRKLARLLPEGSLPFLSAQASGVTIHD